MPGISFPYRQRRLLYIFMTALSNFMRFQRLFLPFCKFFLGEKKRRFCITLTKKALNTPLNLGQCSENAPKGQKQQICEKIHRCFIVYFVQVLQGLYVHIYQIDAKKELKRRFSGVFLPVFLKKNFVYEAGIFSA